LHPTVAVERFGSVEAALRIAPNYDLLILDGPPHSTAGTLRIATASALAVLPTGLSVDDLEPSVLLAHELTKHGLDASRIVFALSRTGDSNAEINEARRYIQKAGYACLAAILPEKTAYRRASDEGCALTETRFVSLKRRADEVAQEIIDRVATLQAEEAA
jgi:chromosome partitioning protein